MSARSYITKPLKLLFVLFYCASKAIAQTSVSPTTIDEKVASELVSKLREKVREQKESLPDLRWMGGVDAKQMARHMLALEGKLLASKLAPDDRNLVAFSRFFKSDAPEYLKVVYASRLPLAAQTIPQIFEVVDHLTDEHLKQRIITSLGSRASRLPDQEKQRIAKYLVTLSGKNLANERISWGIFMSLPHIDEQAAIIAFGGLINSPEKSSHSIASSILKYYKQYYGKVYSAIEDRYGNAAADLFQEVARQLREREKI